MAGEKIKIELPVVPKLDKKAVQSLTRDIRQLEKDLGKVTISLDDLAKHTSVNVKALKDMASASKEMADSFSSSVSKVTKKTQKLKDNVGQVASKSNKEGLQGLAGAADQASKSTAKAARDVRSLAYEYKSLAKDIASAQQKTKQSIEGIFDKIPGLFTKSFMTSIKGITAETGKLFSSRKELKEARFRAGGVASQLGSAGVFAPGSKNLGLPGVSVRPAATRAPAGIGAQVGGAGGGGAGAFAGSPQLAQGISTAAISFGVAAAAITAVVKVLSMASDAQAKFNKSMLDGVGTAGDFNLSAGQYKQSVENIRTASIDATKGLLKIGGSTEITAKILNDFTKNVTGSIEGTTRVVKAIGDGDLEKGVSILARTTMAYGKALNMSLSETSELMGKFTTEMGFGAETAVTMMGQIVSSAASANMPMTRFMNIFKEVTPELELYQNRLEELTGTIKLLSKVMSPRDVQQFMRAFSKGLGGMDFQSRLRTTLIAGTDVTSGTLAADFQTQMKAISGELGDLGPELESALGQGTDQVAAVLNKAMGQGKNLTPALREKAMMIAANEQARRKGGPASTATALAGAGMGASIVTLARQATRLQAGSKLSLDALTGINEHVAVQSGVSKEQVDMLRKMVASLIPMRQTLRKTGLTESKSLNIALRNLHSQRLEAKSKGKPVSEDEIRKAMMESTEEDLLMASGNAKENLDAQSKSFDLAQEQYDLTASISDKFENIVEYWLQRIFNLLTPFVDKLQSILNFTIGGGKKDQMKEVLKLTSAINAENKQFDKNQSKFVNDISSAITSSLSYDENPLASKSVSSSLEPSLSQMNSSQVLGFLESFLGSSDKDYSNLNTKDIMDVFKQFTNAKTTEGKLDSLKGLGEGATGKTLLRLTEYLAKSGLAPKSDEPTRLLARSKTAAERKAAAQTGMAMGGDVQDAAYAASMSTAAWTAATTGASGSTSPTADAAVTTAEATAEAAKTQDSVLEEVGRTADRLDKGIKLDNTYANGKFKNILKDATLDSFRTALMEFAVLQAKIKADPALERALTTGQGWNFASGGKTALDQVLGSESGKSYEALQKWDSKAYGNQTPGHAAGGPINYDQMARLHGGEFVVPRGGALVKSDSPTNARSTQIGSITVNVKTDADPKQIAAEIHKIFSHV